MYYPSKVTWEKYVSTDAHHNITYATPETPSCKYQEMIEKVNDQDGNEVIANAWLLFPPGISIGFNDRITLPDGTHQKIVVINRIKNHMGKDVNVEIYLSKKWSAT